MAKLLAEMSLKEMVQEYNLLTGKSIAKFADRKSAERRLSEARKTCQGDKPLSTPTKPKNPPASKMKFIDKNKACENDFDQQLLDAYGYVRCPHCGEHLSNGVGENKNINEGTHVFECLGCGVGFGEAFEKNKSRAGGASRSWANKKVAKARSQRNGVRVDGQEYKSVRAAFEALHLPLEKHIRFRKLLKESGKERFENHVFTLIA